MLVRRSYRSLPLLLAVAALLLGATAASAATRAATPSRTNSAPAATLTTAPWLSVEQYYLKLMNCTRTGGWVKADGVCVRYGSGYFSPYVAPIRLSAGLSDSVARPWARTLAVKSLCLHGDLAARFASASLSPSGWSENIGCSSGSKSAYAAVLAFHRLYQAERATNGGHWKNLKNPRYTAVGIGVWVHNGRHRLVVDFYRP